MNSRVVTLLRKLKKGTDADFAAAPAATTEVLASTERGRELFSIRYGPQRGPRIAVIAGMHSDELTGVAAAVELAERLATDPPEDAVFHVVAAVDVDGVFEQIDELDEHDLIPSLLSLSPHRDLEGTCRTKGAPETAALCDWLDSIDTIDAFIDLHAANHLVPGGFCYLDGPDEVVVDTAAAIIGTHMAEHDIPRLATDPTGKSRTKVRDGVFSIPPVDDSCVEYVREHFNPSLLMVPELPVGLVEPHGPIGLEKLDAWKRSFQCDDPPEKRRITPCADTHPQLIADAIFDITEMFRHLELKTARP